MTQDPSQTEPTTEVAQGERRDSRIVTDPQQGWKMEPVLPVEGQRNSQEDSRASEQDGPPAMPTPQAAAEADLPSAWEAVVPGKDPADTGE
jgi:hypothetical protein